MPRLTKRLLDNLAPADKEYVEWDTEITGFGVRIRPTGRKVFILKYRTLEGRQRKLSIGPYGRLTVDQARKEARSYLAERDKGGDVATTRSKARKAPTIKDLAERYFNEHAIPHKKPFSVSRDRRLWHRFIAPSFASYKINSITRDDISKLHNDLGKDTPIQANRTLALFSKMMTLAIRWGLRSEIKGNPCQHVQRFREAKRERYLSADELGRLGKALIQVEIENGNRAKPGSIAAIRLLLLTGARLNEVLSLRWEYVDLERCELRLPDSKTGAKSIPLGIGAVELLSALPKTPGNLHVFPGMKFGEHLKDINGTWRTVREKAKLDDVRLHDLRHTFASAGAGAGLGLPVIGALLGHTQATTTQRYSHLASDPLKEAADLINDRLTKALNRPVKDKIIPLKR